MNILKFVSTSLLLFVALTCGAGAKETAVEAKKVAKEAVVEAKEAAKEAVAGAKEAAVVAKEAAKEVAVAAKEVVTREKQFSPEIQEKLQTKMESLIKEINAPGFNVGIWIPGEGEWQNSFGVADKETAEKMSLDKHFRIGSITKTFVTTALLQLVDKGEISLDDKISKYIDNVPNGDEITIRQLANMTSGLANYSEDEEWVKTSIFTKSDRNIPVSELLDVAFKIAPAFAPGKGWHYSNTNTILLGQVIEKISGLSLDQYLQENIFTPLGLSDTSYPLDAKVPSPYAHGYTKQTLDGKEADVTFNNPSWTNAAGQMVSNFADLKIWAKALGTGALLSDNAFKERLSWVTLPPNTEKRKYGLGVGANNGWITHTGSLPGYNCVVAYLPEKQAVLVVTINSDIDLVVKGKNVALTDMVFEAVTKIITPDNVPIR